MGAALPTEYELRTCHPLLRMACGDRLAAFPSLVRERVAVLAALPSYVSTARGLRGAGGVQQGRKTVAGWRAAEVSD